MGQRRLYSVSDLAVELTRDRRTMSDKLRNVPADGELNGRPAWFMMTAVRAVYLDREGTLDGEYERARKDKELADKTALQNAVTRSLDGTSYPRSSIRRDVSCPPSQA
jgi:hypothetical protein